MNRLLQSREGWGTRVSVVVPQDCEGSIGRNGSSTPCSVATLTAPDYYEQMPCRKRDWLRQAEHDLSVARTTMDAGQFDWACFAAQQAAEKALYQHHNAEGWGHVLDRLIEGLLPDEPGLTGLRDKGKALDKCYIPTRYPNGLESGAPADAYTAEEAKRAISYAADIGEVEYWLIDPELKTFTFLRLTDGRYATVEPRDDVYESCVISDLRLDLSKVRAVFRAFR